MKVSGNTEPIFYKISAKGAGVKPKKNGLDMTPFSHEALIRMRDGDFACGSLEKGEISSFGNKSSISPYEGKMNPDLFSQSDIEFDVVRYDLQAEINRLLNGL